MGARTIAANFLRSALERGLTATLDEHFEQILSDRAFDMRRVILDRLSHADERDGQALRCV
jgi:hypothetical protein